MPIHPGALAEAEKQVRAVLQGREPRPKLEQEAEHGTEDPLEVAAFLDPQ